jgi:UDP-N-acetylmuramoylalanine--D-glutamate ligase
MDVRGKKVLILGIGASGSAAARLLARRGALVRCSDSDRGADVVRRGDELKAIGCLVELGGHTEEFARGVDLVVISPGIAPSIPVVKSLEHRGVPVLSELEVASEFCRRPVIAVTGTNGKTTTVTLIERMLTAAGRRAVACGNIGRPFSACVGTEGEAEVVVLEVSSFQLERIRDFRPWIAVVLNVADDHCDRYRTMEDYARAKARIFMNQGAGDWAIVRADERERWERLGAGHAQSVFPFSASVCLEEGASLDGVRLVLAQGGRKVTICQRDDVRLPGGHNIENVLAAAAAAWICDVGMESVRRALRDFSGLPHRMETVGSWNGVSFINDSKATNPDAVLRALRSMGGPVVLIAGGKEKGFDYSVLRDEVSRTVKAAVLIGEAREKMQHDLGGAAETVLAAGLADAVRKAVGLAAPGDTVLLSPSCSSYDMFRNFEERGEEFKRIVREIHMAQST